MDVGAIDQEQQTFDAVPASASAARKFVSGAFGKMGASTKAIGDFQLVVSELAANVIEHGNGESMVVHVDGSDALWWTLRVVSGAVATTTPLVRRETWKIADPAQTSGRGLGIVQHLMDDVATLAENGRFVVQCRQRRTAV